VRLCERISAKEQDAQSENHRMTSARNVHVTQLEMYACGPQFSLGALKSVQVQGHEPSSPTKIACHNDESTSRTKRIIR
jgi:hypothetical protein